MEGGRSCGWCDLCGNGGVCYSRVIRICPQPLIRIDVRYIASRMSSNLHLQMKVPKVQVCYVHEIPI